ncbi:putative lipase atg15 [Kappamyces sp. JEL0680]|nr:putative lipase atg15 [Kappamyces sp. JEL0680]
MYSFDDVVLQEQTLPDPTHQPTVLSFATLTLNSYFEPEDKGWQPVPGWNVALTARFGWENTGIRGYLFEDETQENLIIAIKGTSLATPVGSGPTARLDKLNDNMPNNECSMSCLLKESNFDGSYYNLAQARVAD